MIVIGLDGAVPAVAGGNRTREFEFCLLWDAASAADEPIDLGVKRCRAGMTASRR